MNAVVEDRLEQKKQALTLKEPSLYDVILHNDDFTPMAFVVSVLKELFNLDDNKAKKIMIEAHTKGRAVCGTYTREVAETRIDQAIEYARTHDHPLKWSMEAAYI